MTSDKKYEIGSGNVFEDLQVENPNVQLLKAQIAFEIHKIIKSRELNQIAAARLLGIDQPKVSALANGRLAGFTIDRLVKFLDLLEQDVKFSICPRIKPLVNTMSTRKVAVRSSNKTEHKKNAK